MIKWWSIPAAVILLAGCQDNRGGTQAGDPAMNQGETGTTGTGAGMERSPDYGTGSTAQGTTGGTGTGAMGSQTVTGTVASVSQDEVSVRTQSQGELELQVNDRAQFMMGGRPVQIDQVQEGMPVRATFSQQGDQRQLLRLEVGGGMGTDTGSTGSPGMGTGQGSGQQGTQPPSGY